MFNNGYNAGFCGDGFGYGGAGGGWWAWWIVIMAMFGWGGFGGNRWGEQQQFTQADMQRGFDTQSLLNGQRGLEQGICSLGYDQLRQMNDLGNRIDRNNYDMSKAVCQIGYENSQNVNSLSRQISDCCCENRSAVAQIRYDNAKNTCDITRAIQDAANATIQNDNCNYRALNDRITGLEMSAKDAKISELTALLNKCDRDSSLQTVANQIVDRVAPRAYPSYNVPNPNIGCYQGQYFGGYGCNGYGNWDGCVRGC